MIFIFLLIIDFLIVLAVEYFLYDFPFFDELNFVPFKINFLELVLNCDSLLYFSGIFFCDACRRFHKTLPNLTDLGSFSKCHRFTLNFTGFEENDSGKLPFKYYLLRCCSF